MFLARKQDKSFVHQAFWWSLFIKGLDGLLQFLGGIAVLVLPPETLGNTYRWWTRFLFAHPRAGNPEEDFIRDAAHSFGISVPLLVAIYLLANGIIKLLLVYGLLRERLWVFPAAFVGFGLFFTLEVYRLFVHFYWGILILMCISIFVITMVALEYRKVKTQMNAK